MGCQSWDVKIEWDLAERRDVVISASGHSCEKMTVFLRHWRSQRWAALTSSQVPLLLSTATFLLILGLTKGVLTSGPLHLLFPLHFRYPLPPDIHMASFLSVSAPLSPLERPFLTTLHSITIYTLYLAIFLHCNWHQVYSMLTFYHLSPPLQWKLLKALFCSRLCWVCDQWSVSSERMNERKEEC